MLLVLQLVNVHSLLSVLQLVLAALLVLQLAPAVLLVLKLAPVVLSMLHLALAALLVPLFPPSACSHLIMICS